MAGRRWRVRLSVAANQDFASILQWTTRAFGPMQARDYRQTIVQAIRALQGGPDLPDSRARDELRAGVRILRVARHGRRGRYILVYRVIGEGVVEVLRILHDSMDLARHVP